MARVWDIFVRVSHWAVALAFLVAYLTEDDLLSLHVWAGYVAGVLVVLRVCWGFAGPRHARFSDFVCRPGRVIDYLVALISLRAKRTLGHSPAGGAMAIALWAGLLAVVWSGLELYAVEEGAGPLAALTLEADRAAPARPSLLVFVNDEDDEKDRDGAEHEGGDEQESLWEDIHEALANLVLLLVILHLGGVAIASLVHRENLPWSMVTGRKRPE